MVTPRTRWQLTLFWILSVVVSGFTPGLAKENDMKPIDLWKLANEKKDVFRFSTLITAQNIRDLLPDQAGVDACIDWCRRTAVTRVFVESFRSDTTVPREDLERVRDALLVAGLEVSGCVTTTNVGKRSTGWDLIDCYTDVPTQDHLQAIFEFTASIFDEIMIDDFLFTDCECEACVAAKGDLSWPEYRSDLMVRLSRERILAPARAVNPEVKIIIKYPQWYDNFHNRGYEVVRQTIDYDKIWTGTETRDPDSVEWGRKAQYEAYFIMRWLEEVGGGKNGGGWFDPYGCSPETYVEQARQTVLGDAKEAVLFCYGSLLELTGPANVEKLRTEIPALFELAEAVRAKSIKGISAPKPPNSVGKPEDYVFDFVGMLGLPLVPSTGVQDDQAAFLSVHALKDQALVAKLKQMIDAGRPLLITDGLRDRLKGQVDLESGNIRILEVGGDPWSLLDLDRVKLKEIRSMMLSPFGVTLDAPSRVSLYLIGDDLVVLENFNDERVDVRLGLSGLDQAKEMMTLPVGGEAKIRLDGDHLEVSIGPRTMVAIRTGVN